MTKIGATQPPRKLKLALLLGLSFLPRILSAQWHDSVINVWGDPPYIGYLNRSEGPPAYHLSFEFGLEQWEEGKRATHLYQLWALSCDSSRGKLPGPGTYCSLRREIFTDWKSLGGWRAKIWTYSSTDEDLEIWRADWEEGKLDFELVHAMRPDENIQVFIDMGYEGEGIYLSSFRAMNTRRHRPTGKVATIELKIPQSWVSTSFRYTLWVVASRLRNRNVRLRASCEWPPSRPTREFIAVAAFGRQLRESDALRSPTPRQSSNLGIRFLVDAFARPQHLVAT